MYSFINPGYSSQVVGHFVVEYLDNAPPLMLTLSTLSNCFIKLLATMFGLLEQIHIGHHEHI